MNVSDFMTTKLFTIRFDKKLLVVQEIMNWACIRHVPVVDVQNRLVGLISHRDLLEASVSSLSTGIAKIDRQQSHLGVVAIKDVMHRDVQTITPNASIQAAAKRMVDNKIGCLPVVSGEQLVGIITEFDLLKVLSSMIVMPAGR